MRRLPICCLVPLMMLMLEGRVASGAGAGRIPAGSSPPPGQRLDAREGTLGSLPRNRGSERVRSVVDDRREPLRFSRRRYAAITGNRDGDHHVG